MTKTARQILERVYNKGFNDRCQQEKYADIDNQFVFALSVDQALKEIEALIRNEKLKLLAEAKKRVIPNPTTPAGDNEFVPLYELAKMEAEL